MVKLKYRRALHRTEEIPASTAPNGSVSRWPWFAESCIQQIRSAALGQGSEKNGLHRTAPVPNSAIAELV